MYDVKCFKLAMEFLDDHPAIKSVGAAEQLAQEIQTTIESWIEAEEEQCKPK